VNKEDAFDREFSDSQTLLQEEKDRRVYYQDIVYHVCKILDQIDGKEPGKGIVCGNAKNPTAEVQNRMSKLRGELLPLHRHAGDCSVFASLQEGIHENGICTCGYGLHLIRQGKRNDTQMYSDELMALDEMNQDLPDEAEGTRRA